MNKIPPLGVPKTLPFTDSMLPSAETDLWDLQDAVCYTLASFPFCLVHTM